MATKSVGAPTDTVNEGRANCGISDIEKLSYEIYRYSSFSTNYFPENILLDCPSDQSSRWSVNTNNPPQFLTLKLKRPAVVQNIKFGKFEKPHVCNIKKFRIYGGLDEEGMILLLEGGLKNDNKPEEFKLRHRTENYAEFLPILYLKIVPLLSWGPTFNFSIWYIELHGQDDPMFTTTSMSNYNTLREVEIIRLCLKHFRQQGYDMAFKALQEQTQVHLEHPLISELHRCLVINGDFEKAEEFVSHCINDGLMDAYLKRQDYRHYWCKQQMQNTAEKPGKRGGHQLVMDTRKRLVYLFGGWDGYHDLSDLWAFDIEHNTWAILFEHAEQFNGPTPRSCHKMVYDAVSENIFMLGRYLDNSIRTAEYIKSDFFLYDTRARTWLQICDDTSQVGGPQLVYDHQMCIDSEKRNIYVFGGKILTPRSVTNTNTNEPEYSGLFSYHIATNTWTQILVDCHHASASQADVMSIKSRITHCMVFHNKNRKLYIYGGQRGKEDLNEIITYDVDSQTVSVLNKDVYNTEDYNSNEPSPGYTLRATIDCERDEIYVFSSLNKVKERRETSHMDVSNSFWVYSLRSLQWSRIYTCSHEALNDNAATPSAASIVDTEPCPRYAHQLIYDESGKKHYLFGGNPGKAIHPNLRLDDFWTLTLEKPKRNMVLNKCRFLLRKLHYEEMARVDPISAMQYLRKHISEVIDHTDSEQLKKFHKLAGLLFKSDLKHSSSMATPSIGELSPKLIGKFDKTTNIIEVDSSKKEGDTADFDHTSIDQQILETMDVDNKADNINEDYINKSDTDLTNHNEDLSIESNESGTTNSSSGFSELGCPLSSYSQYRKSVDKRARHDYLHELKNRRTFLFNKLVQLMPANMVQPKRNLSDFVLV